MFDLQQIRRAASEEVLRQMPAAVVVAEAPSGKLVLVNERARRLLERNADWSGPPEPEEIGDFGDLRMFHPDGRPVETEEWPLVRSITSGEEVRGEEHSYLLANGGHLAICSDSSPIRDGEGRVVAGVLIVRDITERKRAEEQIAYHAHLLENVHDAVIATDERFLVTAWNEAAEEMYGWTAKEAVGRNVWSVVPIDLTEAERAGVRREVVEKGRCRTELVAYRKDGTPIETEVTISVVRDERGEVSGYLSVDRDISERKRAEEERQRLASIVQNSSDFIGIADLEWRATFVNEAGQRMVGHTGMEEVRRTRVLDYIMPEDREFVRDEIMPTIMERGNWIGESLWSHLTFLSLIC